MTLPAHVVYLADAMITRIEIDGFKSLRGFALDLDPFTALIGPNGAGKSNVLDALALVGRLSSDDLATALQGGRGQIREQLSTLDDAADQRGVGTLGAVRIAVEALVRDERRTDLLEPAPLFKRLRYEVSIELQSLDGGLTERCVLAAEKLRVPPAADPWLDRHPALARDVSRGSGEDLFSFESSTVVVTDPACPRELREPRPVVLQYVQQRAFLSEPSAQASSPHLGALAEDLRRLRVAHLEPGLLREPSDRFASRMTSAGANLARELAQLSAPPRGDVEEAARPGALGRIRARLVELIPGVRTVEVIRAGDQLVVEVALTDGRRFSSRVLSDGTLRVLGLLTLLETTPRGALLAVEEPENGVHPARARALVDILREAAADEPDGVQVLLTSHSPAVLAALLDRPRDVVYVDMVRDGRGPRRSRARPIADPGEDDRGEQKVSRREIERVLATAGVEGGA